ncbi:MarR family winged helix-turn-helix transcriptional regulator [Massilia sp. TSP1-1-2]|uniref:MarR family winged helix-turn-helix transcriptional regulator n=1 Tax=unclassified Massilia TaxID=2609279 RepID=UPI003CFB0155
MTDLIEKPLGCTCFKLRKLTRAMSRLYDQHMATVGLKTTQYSLLVNAARAALPVAELADILGLDRTTLTRNLRPLLDAGWVELKSGADSRQRIVTITGSGRQMLKRAYIAWRRAQTEFETRMGRDAVRALHQQLETTMIQLTPLLEDASHEHAQ